MATIKIKNFAPQADRPTRMFVTLLGDVILNIKDTGVEVFD